MTFRDFIERYGVTLSVVAILAIVLAILPGNAPGRSISEIGTRTAGAGAAASELGEAADAVGGATTSAAGRGGGGGAGTVVGGLTPGGDVGDATVQFGKGDCRPDGREFGISIYQPPCVLWSGPNGGATARGVLPDKIVVVRWMGQVDEATQAILEANKLADDEETRARAYEALRRYSNRHSVTYGREVVLVKLPAGGPSNDDRAMRADAVKIAEDMKAFAVIEGTPDAGIPKVLAQELARRGVICMCTSSFSSQFYLENPPYIFGTGLPTSTDYAIQIGEFIGKRVAGRNAKWAGDDLNPTQGYRTKKRVFGLLYIEGARDRVDPEGKRYADRQKAELAKYGVKLAVSRGYLYDPGRNQNDISTVIADFRDKGVTTLIAAVDPLSPILITREATNQRWFPEWFVTGSGLSDTTTAGRLYDSNQWSRAYGISPLWVTWENVNKSSGYRAFHHGMPGRQPGDEGVLINIYAAFVGQVFIGVQLAGPILTRDSFSQAMYRFPFTGGIPGGPLVGWTRDRPTAIKDFTEVWFDINRQGKDERGEQGNGMMMKVDGGIRYVLGSWPRTEPKAFVENGKEIAVSDNPPGGGILGHEEDGHRHFGRCKTCPGYRVER